MAFFGCILLSGWVSAFPEPGYTPSFVRGFLRGALVAVATGAALVIAQSAYLWLVWGDFSAKMAEFTETTLKSRGADPEYTRSFTNTVANSWRTPNVAVNSFLRISPWGGAFSLLASAASAGVRRWRSARAERSA